jgi:ABC-type multidrug transport system ATPase subunit
MGYPPTWAATVANNQKFLFFVAAKRQQGTIISCTAPRKELLEAPNESGDRMELKAIDISKSYRNKHALNHVSACFTPGIYGLLGPNGAGKSTLMNILVGLRRPTEGQVIFDGEEIHALGAQYREHLGYLPQDVGFYRGFSGEKMLQYMAALKGIEDKKEAASIAKELLEKVNLSADGHRKIGQYSGGMKQRIGIAQALIGNPKILIFDEPTAGLDPKERIRFMNILSEFANTRIVILATHIVSDVEQIAGQILFLKEGVLISQGSMAQCLSPLDGKVWELTCPRAEYDALSARFSLSQVVSEDELLRVRLVAKTLPRAGAQRVAPTLADGYMHFFGEAE